MAHYDCTNCGHTLGISFGRCEACTPQRYFDLQNELKDIADAAVEAWRVHCKKEQLAFVDEYLVANLYHEKKEEFEKIRPQ
jgi:predicted ATP-dependent serine protease|tara:strand:+ start:3027 stop:3269 length:243 start_codon:yes stop_codon:yes gene_type:complete